MASEVNPTLIDSWKKIQNDLQSKIITCNTEPWQNDDDFRKLKLVAGLDISYPKDAHDMATTEACVGMVICSFPDMIVLHQQVLLVQMNQPYVPGFLAFKELPALEKIIQKVLNDKPELTPDLYLVDGNGLLHPQKCGLACHLGIHVSTSTIGVAKNPFVMMHNVEEFDKKKERDKLHNVGDWVGMEDAEGIIIGAALKTTQDAKNPVYVSVGHKINLETARKIVLKCCKHRVPEPLRFADQISREFVRSKEGSS